MAFGDDLEEAINQAQVRLTKAEESVAAGIAQAWLLRWVARDELDRLIALRVCK